MCLQIAVQSRLFLHKLQQSSVQDFSPVQKFSSVRSSVRSAVQSEVQSSQKFSAVQGSSLVKAYQFSLFSAVMDDELNVSVADDGGSQGGDEAATVGGVYEAANGVMAQFACGFARQQPVMHAMLLKFS